MKYDIIIADPPWPYNSNRQLYTDSTTGEIGSNGADVHYHTMTMEDLCALPIKKIAAKNCLLYLWTTGTKLPESIRLIEAWGFKYSTVAYVWDKRIPLMGYYSMSQTEFLLVAKRGKCPPRIKLPKGESTKQLQAYTRGEHSKKPEEFQTSIEKHWDTTGLHKIELFARRFRPGWDCVGNEINGTIEDFLDGKPIGPLHPPH